MKKTTIVIPILNSTKTHEKMTDMCVKKIREITSDIYDLMIIDNGSISDNTYGADIYIKNDKNLGIAPSWNMGIKRTNTEYITIINNDIFPLNGWLEKMINTFNDNENVGASACCLIDNESQIKQMLNPPYWNGVNGACFTISRNTVDKVGYFDEQFVPCFFEDEDYWERIEQEKMELVMCSGYIIHLGRSTCNTLTNMNEIFNRNKKLFEQKWRDR